MKLEKFSSRWLPPGMSCLLHVKVFIIGNVLASLGSLSFLARYIEARNALYSHDGTERLIQGAVMTAFPSLLGNSLVGFLLIGSCMTGFVFYHYAYFKQDSKSIYLMKRLPDRLVLHRMAWSLPILALFACLALALLHLLCYFIIYWLATPAECLTPYGWKNLWGILK